MEKKYKFNPKPLFEKRMNQLLPNKKDQQAYWKVVHTLPSPSIRCNTLKIHPSKLKSRLQAKEWKINQPFKTNPEIMIITNKLQPGELGKSHEHLLGHYYVQGIESMMPLLTLKPTDNDNLLDLCASPGSKTTQASAMMNNKGAIIANDNKLLRLRILASNLERCGCSNCLLINKQGEQLCKTLNQQDYEFDKILVDAPCSGEGTLRTSPKTFIMWNYKMIKKFSRHQKLLAEKAFQILKPEGEMIYSTCTHSPEENEEVIQHLLNKYENKIQIQQISLPLKTRPGLTSWQDAEFHKDIQKTIRIYPQDNNTEGFFIAKLKKIK